MIITCINFLIYLKQKTEIIKKKKEEDKPHNCRNGPENIQCYNEVVRQSEIWIQAPRNSKVPTCFNNHYTKG